VECRDECDDRERESPSRIHARAYHAAPFASQNPATPATSDHSGTSPDPEVRPERFRAVRLAALRSRGRPGWPERRSSSEAKAGRRSEAVARRTMRVLSGRAHAL
jgi:hypothetical protein